MREKKERNAAIVLAAGRGSRMHSTVQKQYMALGAYPVLYYSLKRFEEFADVDEIILVTGEEEVSYCKEKIVEAYGLKKVGQIIPGGKERYHSVYQGLCALKDCDYVFIHDGARPFADGEMLVRVMEAVRKYKACVVGMPVKDTIKMSDEKQFAVQTPDRSRLWTVQTPQVFSYGLIKEAYDRLFKGEYSGITDDAMVVEQTMHHPVKLVEGSYRNIKITTPEDILIAEAFLTADVSEVSGQRAGKS
ncbi:MAG: 2-C-methyl-D-erythritol 4-phosphate cytidylyltransferase [Lachnospiraceae bacterium]|nr:2-C-methyl-D-erythritol 4-phosphate cytidylyltransferase [Lachnospiraceae bacterium]